MDERDYIDCIERLVATSEVLLDCLVLVGAIAGILVAKDICTLEEIEEAKAIMSDSDSAMRARQKIDSLKQDIEQRKKIGGTL